MTFEPKDHLQLPQTGKFAEPGAQAKELRRQTRYSTEWSARCVGLDGKYWDVTVVDVSEDGFGLSMDLPVPVDTHVDVALADVGVFPGRVVWKGGGRCGLQLMRERAVVTEEQSAKLIALLD